MKPDTDSVEQESQEEQDALHVFGLTIRRYPIVSRVTMIRVASGIETPSLAAAFLRESILDERSICVERSKRPVLLIATPFLEEMEKPQGAPGTDNNFYLQINAFYGGSSIDTG